eukprot:754804-Hanusia_phi.AAC.3
MIESDMRSVCLDRVNVDDICAWGKPPSNSTFTDAFIKDVLPSTTPAPPQWPAITGRPALVYLPGVGDRTVLSLLTSPPPGSCSRRAVHGQHCRALPTLHVLRRDGGRRFSHSPQDLAIRRHAGRSCFHHPKRLGTP